MLLASIPDSSELELIAWQDIWDEWSIWKPGLRDWYMQWYFNGVCIKCRDQLGNGGAPLGRRFGWARPFPGPERQTWILDVAGAKSIAFWRVIDLFLEGSLMKTLLPSVGRRWMRTPRLSVRGVAAPLDRSRGGGIPRLPLEVRVKARVLLRKLLVQYAFARYGQPRGQGVVKN